MIDILQWAAIAALVGWNALGGPIYAEWWVGWRIAVRLRSMLQKSKS